MSCGTSSLKDSVVLAITVQGIKTHKEVLHCCFFDVYIKDSHECGNFLEGLKPKVIIFSNHLDFKCP
jgi:hypothetical protein